MFAETLPKLFAARKVDRVVVASMDERILAAAFEAGALTLREPDQQGHSHSADRAAGWCAEQGATRVLLAPIDVPLARSSDFDDVVEASLELGSPSLVIVPSREGTGTNALVQCPPGVIGCRFGPGSYRLHSEAAAAAGAQVSTVRLGGLTFDIDTPQDAEDFLSAAPTHPLRMHF